MIPSNVPPGEVPAPILEEEHDIALPPYRPWSVRVGILAFGVIVGTFLAGLYALVQAIMFRWFSDFDFFDPRMNFLTAWQSQFSSSWGWMFLATVIAAAVQQMIEAAYERERRASHALTRTLRRLHGTRSS